MFWLIGSIWGYRSEIILAIQLLAKLRKSAQEFTRAYIRKQIKERFRHALVIVGMQVFLLFVLSSWNTIYPSLTSRLFASIGLWIVTVFNLAQLFFITIPELKNLYRTLKGKTGYALKYFLEISLVTELLRLNVLFLTLCMVVGMSSRTIIGMQFSYVKPWKVLWQKKAN